MPFPCDLCNYLARDNAGLREHKQNKHNIDIEWKQCDLGEKQFKQVSSLKKHRSEVHKIDIIWKQCDRCEEKFIYIRDKKNHMRQIHGVHDWHKCAICSQDVEGKINFGRHMKTHL